MKKFVKNALWFVGGMLVGSYALASMQVFEFDKGLAYCKFKDGGEYGDPSIVNPTPEKKKEETPD